MIKLLKRLGIGLIFVIGLLSQGCGFSVNCIPYTNNTIVNEEVDGWYLIIKSDGYWSGSVGLRSVDGFGDGRLNLPAEPLWTASFLSKQCKKGYLTVQVFNTDGRKGEPLTTTAAFGAVTLMSPMN